MLNKYILKLKDYLRNPIRSKLLILKHIKNVSFVKSSKQRQVIICFDGFSQHGGLVDRLKGMISFFEASKLTGFEFKIYHKFPYELKAFLEPNQYNWIATKKDMNWLPFKTKFLYSMLDFNLNPVTYLQHTNKTKLFVYNNIDYLKKIYPECSEEALKVKWSTAFNTLFKKSNFLQEQLNSQQLHKKRLAIHSRFTSILGDFIDTDSKVLPKEEQEQLFRDLEFYIKTIAKKEKINSVYIFSDSIIYLNHMRKYSTFNILDGIPLHPDNKKGYSYTLENHAKTFIDFFAIAESTKVILVRKSFMYPSAYPKYASYLNAIDFKQDLIE